MTRKKEQLEPTPPIALNEWLKNIESALRLKAPQKEIPTEVLQAATVEVLELGIQYWRDYRFEKGWRDRGAKRPSSKKEIETRVAELSACWKTLSTLILNLPDGKLDLLPDLRAAFSTSLRNSIANTSLSGQGGFESRFYAYLVGYASTYPLNERDYLLEAVMQTLLAVRRLAKELRAGSEDIDADFAAPPKMAEVPRQWSTPLRIAHVRRLIGIFVSARGERIVDLKIGNPDTGGRQGLYNNPLLTFLAAANSPVSELGGECPLYISPYTLRMDAIAIQTRERKILKSKSELPPT